MTTTPRNHTPRSRTDRKRRQRILDATLAVIIDHGISGLSHRIVARTAGVPLSATSYYFGTIDELIEAAFTEAVERDAARFLQQLDALPFEDDAVGAISTLSSQMLQDSSVAVLAFELCVAALRNERLKPLARSWDDGWCEMLIPHLGPRRARLASAIMAGIMMRGTMSTGPMPLDEITNLVRDSFEAVPAD